MYFKDLFIVLNVAILCMVAIMVIGDAVINLLPKPEKGDTIYECDVRMSGHILTVPCTIRGKHYAV